MEKGNLHYASHKLRRAIFGSFFLDCDHSCNNDDLTFAAYKAWRRMIARCHRLSYIERNPTYGDCSICNEWHLFSNFEKWYKDNYIKGNELDKDILVKGNKTYSPQTCCFVPQEINKLLIKRNRKRGKHPIGVYSPKKGLFLAQISIGHKIKTIGYFKNELDAFYAYKKKKESYIKEKALEYYQKGLIKKEVFDALNKYEVNIND